MKIRILATAIVLCMLAGCSVPNSLPDSNPDSSTVYKDEKSNSEKTVNGSSDVVKTGTGNNGSDRSEDRTNDKTPDTVKQEQSATWKNEVGKKLDYGILDRLNDTKYGWGLSLNKTHSVPGIPSHVRELLSRYEGIYTGDTSKKVIYLTFDEGYENGYTVRILDTLKENNVKALFFVTGPYIKQHADLIRRMLDEGHAVGNHTLSHPTLPGLSDAALEKELLETENMFYSRFGKTFKYMRPPKGEFSEKVLAASQQLGYKTVFWSYAYLDYDVKNQKGADHAYGVVMENLHNGAVILLHAVSEDNALALDRIIKGIRAEGYTLEPFDL